VVGLVKSREVKQLAERKATLVRKCSVRIAREVKQLAERSVREVKKFAV